MPDSVQVELLEAQRSGSIDTYDKLVRYMDEQMSLAVLGEQLTTTPKATGIGTGSPKRTTTSGSSSRAGMPTCSRRR
jgi:phage gp29-like protein